MRAHAHPLLDGSSGKIVSSAQAVELIHEGDTVKLVFEKGAPHGPNQPAFHDWPDGQGAARVGKKAAGRLLDGCTWDGFPLP